MTESPTAQGTFALNDTPFGWSISTGERTILQTAVAEDEALARPGAFCRDGQWRYVTQVLAQEATADGMRYRCATDDPTFEAVLDIAYMADGLALCWAPADGKVCEVIGDVYSLASAGHWYGHGYHEPQYWPLDAGAIRNDPLLCNNVQSPIWLASSGAGIVIPTEELLSVSLNVAQDGVFRIGMKHVASFAYRILVGRDIRETFDLLLGIVGKPQRVPDLEEFAKPIYSTWTQYPRYLTQDKVLDFARQICAAGLPVGIMQIDEKYQPSFGEISFDPSTFPDPQGMMRELREMGFVSTLWTSPFINTDSPAFAELRELGALVRNAQTGEPGIFTWWAGDAGLLDVTHPAGEAWYAGHLHAMEALGFVGFKFDGGDGKYTPPFAESAFHQPQRPQGYSNRYLEFMAKHFPRYSESRVAWMVQGEGLLTREGGKDTHWGLDNGLRALVTQGMTQSLLGYPYLICDMIPGRVQTRFPDAPLPTDELFLRWTEVSALTPIMQFSYGPWNYSAATCGVARAYAWLHQDLGPYLYAMAQHCPQSGAPIVRPLFLDFPGEEATYMLDDEFLLGDDLLVAPVLSEGAVARDIYLPTGSWRDAWTGTLYEGPCTLADHPAPCPGIPLFVRQDGAWSERLEEVLAQHLPNIPRGNTPSGVTTASYSAPLFRIV
ncbi:MAG TPA: glycoside hydrolase family 31 protein [Armatimonadota bacterium]|jgi:alpha-glucosidase (family GH31 glycosyl hydrolase)